MGYLDKCVRTRLLISLLSIIVSCFATHLSDAGADLNAIKTLLGHSSLAATQVYMHNSVEKLKKIYDQAHPKS